VARQLTLSSSAAWERCHTLKPSATNLDHRCTHTHRHTNTSEHCSVSCSSDNDGCWCKVCVQLDVIVGHHHPEWRLITLFMSNLNAAIHPPGNITTMSTDCLAEKSQRSVTHDFLCILTYLLICNATAARYKEISSRCLNLLLPSKNITDYNLRNRDCSYVLPQWHLKTFKRSFINWCLFTL